MPFARCPDARIWWDQSGTGDPILLIMGHAYGADMWHRTAPELAASYRVIRFDNRGGGSDPPGPLRAADGRGRTGCLDAARAAPAHVYGVSPGGAIALQLALDHPGRVRSLTLGCTAASAQGASRGALLTRVRSLLPAAALNRMARKLLYGPDTPAGRRAEDQQIVGNQRFGDEVDVQTVDPRHVRRDYAECACHGQGHSNAGGHGAVGSRDHQS